MKRKYIYQYLLILITIVSGLACNEEEAFVLRNTDVLDFSYEASSQTFTIRSNGAWSVSSPDEWIVALTPESGSGDGVAYENVTVTVAHNGGAARSGKIDIHAAGKEIYISVHQNEGFLLFGQPSLSGSLAVGEPVAGINLRIPYSRAAGNEQFNVSVSVSGEAAAGIDPVDNYPVSLTGKEGMIYVPLTGQPVKDGELRF